jgi:broad specificity phosphatase PhoE
LRCCRFYVDPYLHAAPVSATIFLARHASHDEVGKVLSGRSDIPINAAGHAEAARLADRLSKVPVAAIHSSPRRRARETAETVAMRHGLGVQAAPALDEIDFGAWMGKPFAELEADAAWKAWNAARSTASPPGGEGMHATTTRAVRHIEEAAGNSPLLCVSHCDVIRGVVAHYLGLDANRLLRFDIDPASLTELELYGDGSGRVVALNERPL